MGGGVDFQKMYQRLSMTARDFFYLPPSLPFHTRDKLRPRSSKSFTLGFPQPRSLRRDLGLRRPSPRSVAPPPPGFQSELPQCTQASHLLGFTPGVKMQMVGGQQVTEESHWGMTAGGGRDWGQLGNRSPMRSGCHPPPASLHRKAARCCLLPRCAKF